jgi:alkaline phosphatase D
MGGADLMGQFQVTAKVAGIASYRLVVSASDTLSSPFYGESAMSESGRVRLNSPSLTPEKWYWGIEQNGRLLDSPRGEARIAGASHKVCHASCASTGSNASVFSRIEAEDPDMFFHLGDMHYQDLTSTSEAAHIAALSGVFSSPLQRSLYLNVPTLYMPDDHDGGGGNDHPGNTTTAAASAGAWRKKVPYPTLELSGSQDGRYFSFDVGRVRYVFTDQRRYASAIGATDNSSKTILGATQKTWFKDLIQNSDGYLIVWCSTRVFHANTIAGHDSWGGFTTERTEICNHIKTHASGRVLILTGDRHQAGIDDGTNCNYATGGDPIVIQMAAPLDRTSNTHGLATFSSGVFSNNGQYGVLEIADTGGASIDVDLAIRNTAGADLATLSYSVDLS